MKNILALFLVVALLFSGCLSNKKVTPPSAFGPVPSKAQLAWHEMELNAFIHFTTNTFTDLEWGNGDEDPAVFNPTSLDAEQWVKTLKNAGFKMVILTCKHHDGFCLWPSKFTRHSIQYSPYKNGKGDVVREVSDACKKYGMKFGVYLSPWDRNHAEYGREGYLTYYRNQLKEIFSNYGPITEMWFDGANGGSGYYGGARETRKINSKTYYDWPATMEIVRKLEPEVLFFSDAGPSIRWVGNEKGIAGATNWNTITTDTLYAGKSGIEDLLGHGSPEGKQWVPAEVDVSIRPGWFYHAKEDSLVKTPRQLFEIYLNSVGHGSTLLLNIPPDKRGLFHETDIASLNGFRTLLNHEFANDLALHAKVSTSAFRGNSEAYAGDNLTDGNKETYWATDEGVTQADFEVSLKKKTTVKYIVLQEYIQLGQRVSAFTVKAWQNNSWQTIAEATTIGHKRILPVKPTETDKIKVEITASKACPLICNIEIY